MREIKFRGKRLDNGEWVYGDLVHSSGLTYITTEALRVNTYIEINSNTVGQYTCLKDKKGKEIFEGDIVKVNGYVHSIEWNNKAAGFRLSTKGSSHAHTVFLSNIPTLEIIGNIYENPELLAA